MATVETRTGAAPASPGHAEPSVLVLLVVRDGSAWLRQCLMALAKQTYPRIGVLAIDNASSDGSADLLEAALGPDRVMRSDRNAGFSGAVAIGLASEAAQHADYVLLLHDDTLLDPGAVAAMVDAAERVEGVGMVGPKVVDWDQPRVLQEIGMSTDRFGYPYSPLEEAEIDQGQYDRIREVLYVSSCAMLVSREAWNRIGAPDERLWPAHEDLDFCWRARLAGFRVLMTPKAVARHRGASARSERGGAPESRRVRYHRERVALASLLKNYSILSLIWILPLYVVQGSGRVAVLVATRRFQDAYQVVAAWAWNIAHLPGTLRRRVRAQAVRGVPDRSVRRSMAPAWTRVRRLAQSATLALAPASEDEERAGRFRFLWFPRAHPVATAWALAVVVAAVGYRDLLTTSSLTGGGLGSFPASPSGFFREFVSGLRHTGLGGSQAASPALGLLGIGSVLSLGSPALLEKALLLGLPAVAAVGCYRVVRQQTGETLPAAVSAACYGLSSVTLWAISEGRIPVLVLLAGMPWLTTKLSSPFEAGSHVPARRWVAGAAIGLAVLGSFFPGVVLSAGVLVIAAALTPGEGSHRVRGLSLCVLGAIGAALLVLPLTIELTRGAAGLADHAGGPRFGALARLWMGTGPGSWPTGFFLPAVAALAMAFVSNETGRRARRAAVAVVLSLYLSWLAAAGYLPTALRNVPAYLAVAAFGLTVLVGVGLADLLRGVGRATFGHRQLAAAAMAVALGVGLGAQATQATIGSWTVGGPDRVDPAYGLVDQPPPDYRVLWLGGPGGDAFPAPGGLPDGTVAAGQASVRFAVRDPSGASALDIGRPSQGSGYDRLELALSEILAGPTRHGGALLAPFGIRFIVARPQDLPLASYRRLARQIDLDLIPTEGLIVFRDDKAAEVAAVVESVEWRRTAPTRDQVEVEMLPRPDQRSLSSPSDETFAGEAITRPSLVFLAQQFDGRWRLHPEGGEQQGIAPVHAFGWAVAFRVDSAPAGLQVRYGGQAARTREIALLAVLWAAALWLTRRPVRGG